MNKISRQAVYSFFAPGFILTQLQDSLEAEIKAGQAGRCMILEPVPPIGEITCRTKSAALLFLIV